MPSKVNQIKNILKVFVKQKRRAELNPRPDLLSKKKYLSNLWKKYLGFLPLEGDAFIEAGGDSHLAVLLVQEFEDLTGKYVVS